MKKLVGFLCVSILLIPAMRVEAVGIGEAETQGQGELSVAIEQEIVFERDMELKSISPDVGTQATDMKFDEMYRTDVKISYGMLDNFDIFVKLGGASFEMEEEWRTTTPEVGSIKDDAETSFMWGIGMKGTLSLEDDWMLGVDVQYLAHDNDYDGRIDNRTTPADSEDYSGEMEVEEWHVAPYIAKAINSFTPYVGVKYSDVRIENNYTTSSGSTKEKREADENVGVFIGLDYKIDTVWKLNIEGRFIDETAMSLGAMYKF